MEIHRNCLLQVVGGWDNLSKCKERLFGDRLTHSDRREVKGRLTHPDRLDDLEHCRSDHNQHKQGLISPSFAPVSFPRRYRTVISIPFRELVFLGEELERVRNFLHSLFFLGLLALDLLSCPVLLVLFVAFDPISSYDICWLVMTSSSSRTSGGTSRKFASDCCSTST